MKKSELKALIREVIDEAMSPAALKMAQTNSTKYEYDKLLKAYSNNPDDRSYVELQRLGRNIGKSLEQIKNDIKDATRKAGHLDPADPADNATLNNFIFESKLKALIRKVVKEAMFPPMNMAVMQGIQNAGKPVNGPKTKHDKLKKGDKVWLNKDGSQAEVLSVSPDNNVLLRPVPNGKTFTAHVSELTWEI